MTDNAPFHNSERRVPILANETGDELRLVKLRYAYDLCWHCQRTEPVATVQGKAGAWYHLHPRRGDTLSDRQRAILRTLDPDEMEGLFEWDGGPSHPVKQPSEEALKEEAQKLRDMPWLIEMEYSGRLGWRKRAIVID